MRSESLTGTLSLPQVVEVARKIMGEEGYFLTFSSLAFTSDQLTTFHHLST